MVILCGVKRFQYSNLRDNRSLEDPGSVELRDIRLGDALLLRTRREDRRAVLRADVRPLVIALGRVMGHREEELEEFSVGNHPRIERDLDGLGMAGIASAH